MKKNTKLALNIMICFFSIITINAPIFVVAENSHPTLEFEKKVIIHKGESYDPLKNVKAYDKEDGVVQVSYTGFFDIQKPGKYELHYKAVDSDGNSVEGTQTLIVNSAKEKITLDKERYTVFTNDKYEIWSLKKEEVHIDDISKATDKELIRRFDVHVIDTVNNKDVTKDSDIQVKRTDTSEKICLISFDLSPEMIESIKNEKNKPQITAEPFVEVQKDSPYELEAIATDVQDGSLEVTSLEDIDTTQTGVFSITLVAEDTEGNRTLKKQILLVNDGTYSVGNLFILKAVDFAYPIKTIEEQKELLNNEDAFIKENAKIEVFDKKTGANVTNTANLIYSDFKLNYGLHMPKISVQEDLNASRKIRELIVTELPKDIPMIYGMNYTIVPENALFNPYEYINNSGVLEYVIAYDTKDGFLNLTQSSEVHTSQPGLQPLLYSVIDSDGNQSSFLRFIFVDSGTYSISKSTNYYIQSLNQPVIPNITTSISTFDRTPAYWFQKLNNQEILSAYNVQIFDIYSGEDVTSSKYIHAVPVIYDDGTYAMTFLIKDQIIDPIIPEDNHNIKKRSPYKTLRTNFPKIEPLSRTILPGNYRKTLQDDSKSSRVKVEELFVKNHKVGINSSKHVFAPYKMNPTNMSLQNQIFMFTGVACIVCGSVISVFLANKKT